ncbi:hypothetical protein QE152_g9298 [Popillia japonica]|uniref:Uncharacterized protein n=1 Tax=Popillia japonica TaxID=7064 RepID=A0AAW1LXV5_POPJA
MTASRNERKPAGIQVLRLGKRSFFSPRSHNKRQIREKVRIITSDHVSVLYVAQVTWGTQGETILEIAKGPSNLGANLAISCLEASERT